MASKPNISPEGHGQQHYLPPNARELRAQAVNRLQVGLFGLAAMLLLIGLANIIMDRARLADSLAGVPGTAASASAEKTSDPLADIGAVPSPDTATSASPRPEPAARR